MKVEEIKQFCLKWDSNCKNCVFFGVCNKPPFSWSEEDIKRVDSYIAKRDEIDETFKRR